MLYDSVPASHQLGVPKSPDRDPDMIRVKRNARNTALIDIAIVRGDNSATGLNLTTAEAYRLTKLLTHVIIETSQQQAA
ncbi:hypothetical protein [Pelistega indica]|uniref:hypothetical protein n=1 Tax=Pelistega indica TaxID=1414851 RepID=UPI0011C7970D|nr:hypothetical protein [Pelistega indica]